MIEGEITDRHEIVEIGDFVSGFFELSLDSAEFGILCFEFFLVQIEFGYELFQIRTGHFPEIRRVLI